jgi:hypothetical protein
VVYDPGAVTVEQIEKLLLQSGTYIMTVSEPKQQIE